MKDGFIKISAYSPVCRVGDIDNNCKALIEAAKSADKKGVNLLVFPELSLVGATSGDLLKNDAFLTAAERALAVYRESTKELNLISFIGVPVLYRDKLYNCAAAVFCGKILGLVPKAYINEKEARIFAAAPSFNSKIEYAGCETVFGASVLFENKTEPGVLIGCEIGEDAFAVVPPSSYHAQNGANVIVCLSSFAEAIGEDAKRRLLVKAQSARILGAYAFANASEGESGTDEIYSGHNIIAAEGEILAESQPFSTDNFVYSTIDISKISHDRRTNTSFSSDIAHGYEVIPFFLEARETVFDKEVNKLPFLPSEENLKEDCLRIFELQSRALALRLSRSYSKKLVIGVSGGLDSTLAMLVCRRAADILGMPTDTVLAVTMPCFGTTERTKSNAEKLSDCLGAELRKIDISESVKRHLSDIGHDGVTTDVTYENSQARERTQVLMDIANATGGLVVGTGDLSELVLGWATYNGDHMSMYGVNGSIPKTLIRKIVDVYARNAKDSNGELSKVLFDILDTPVSPELLPPKDGDISQKTEDLVGPYELHDFFIYHTLKNGFSPKKVFRLARKAFENDYSPEVILGWLRVFARRFINQQFKRSCQPDGIRVGAVSVSPRGALLMPSDASVSVFQRELSELDSNE